MDSAEKRQLEGLENDLRKEKAKYDELQGRREEKKVKKTRLLEQIQKMKQNLEDEDKRFLALIRRSREEYVNKEPAAFVDAALLDKTRPNSLAQLENEIRKLEHHVRLLNEDITDIDKEQRLSMAAQGEIEDRIDAIYINWGMPAMYIAVSKAQDAFETWLNSLIRIQSKHGNSRPGHNWTHMLAKMGVAQDTIHCIDTHIGPHAAAVRADFFYFLNDLMHWDYPGNQFFRATIKDRKPKAISGFAGGR